MDVSKFPNPFDEILERSNCDLVRLQAFCEVQRSERNSRYKAKLLDDDFEGVQPDQILINLLTNPNYVDPRNNLCIWARPPATVVDLVSTCQKMLKKMSPNVWLTPLECLHMTVLEISHSLTPCSLAALVAELKPSVPKFERFYQERPARLVKPRLSFDDTAIALTYLPAASESSVGEAVDDSYTYLHLRRDLLNFCQDQNVEVNARYASASCHLTIARFTTDKDHCSTGKPDRAAMISWVSAIEQLNELLAEEYWPCEGILPEAGTWIVGAQRDLEIRKGTLWYGGGQSLDVGSGL